MTTPLPPGFTPVLKPPPGVTPDPLHPATLDVKTNATVAVGIGVTSIIFLCRAYVRLWIKRDWAFDDWLALLSWMGAVACCGLTAAVMGNYGGRHMWDIDKAELMKANYWFNIASVEYGVGICLTKVAVLTLYRKIFSPRRWSPFDIVIVGLIIIMCLFYGVECFLKIFECTPRAKILDKSVPGTCLDEAKLLNSSGLFNTITDYIILLLPIHAVSRLQLDRKKKLLVVLVFTFGLCAPVFSTVGFVVRIQISGSADTNWNDPIILLWGLAELTAGNLCLNFPEMVILFNKSARNRSKPSAQRESILKASALSRSRKTGTARDPYYELDDQALYGVHVSRARDNSSEELTNSGVHVTYDITVESEEARKVNAPV